MTEDAAEDALELGLDDVPDWRDPSSPPSGRFFNVEADDGVVIAEVPADNVGVSIPELALDGLCSYPSPFPWLPRSPSKRNGGNSIGGLYSDMVDAATLTLLEDDAFGVMAESRERKDLSSGFGDSLRWFITCDREGALGFVVVRT